MNTKDTKEKKDKKGKKGKLMAIDPRLNCAARICCPPPAARATQIELLCEAGCPDDLAPKIAERLEQMGISFAPVELMAVIAELAEHPNRAG